MFEAWSPQYEMTMKVTMITWLCAKLPLVSKYVTHRYAHINMSHTKCFHIIHLLNQIGYKYYGFLGL